MREFSGHRTTNYNFVHAKLLEIVVITNTREKLGVSL